MNRLLIVFTFCILFLINIAQIYGNVIGIDFASDALKIALVKPGHPLEIVTNFQSKRKTPTCIAFYKGERSFGSDAVALMGRKPELTFEKVFRLLGKDPSHPNFDELVKAQYHPYNIYKNETTGFATFKVEDTYYTSEELIAMMLQHVKDITANFASGQPIKDCVITVPSYFTQHEREALYTAAAIADLKVLSLIEENTAAALNYATDRTFDQPTNVLYYNMGAGSTQVSIVHYSSYQAKEAGKNKTIGQFEVVGKAWDANLGGFNFDLKIVEFLADKFNELWRKKPSGKDKDVRAFVRPMTRLRLEAVKIKEILSANQDFPFRIEQLHADIDLAGKISRNDFENTIAADLFDRVLAPVEAALASANLTIADINSVELLGGGFRIPKVKRILDDYFKTKHNIEVGQHLNGDESMALGAAFRAANLSTQFRVRKIGASDTTSLGINVRLEGLPKEAEEAKGGLFSGLFGSSDKKKDEKETAAPAEPWIKQTTLFPVKSAIPSKVKTVAFHHDTDILCKIEYENKEALPQGTDALVAMYNITGVAAFAKEAVEKGYGATPKVHLSFGIDNSGMMQLFKAEATVELPSANTTATAEASTNTTEAATEGAAATPEGESAESAPVAEGDAKNETDAKAETKKPKAEAKKDDKKKATSNIIRRTLTITSNDAIVTPPRWTPAHIAEAKAKLRALQVADDHRKAKAAALNDLEAYIYKVKNRLMEEEDKLKAVSTDEQRQEVVDLANAAEDWLYDEGRDQEVPVYQGKQNEIKSKAEAIFNRFAEVSARSEAVKKATKALEDVRRAVDSWAEKMPQITEDEKADLLKLVTKAEAWIEEKSAAQEKHSPFEKPIFHSSEVQKEIKPVAALFEKLLKKPKPAPPVVEKKNTTSAENATESGTNSTTFPEEEEVVRVKVNMDESAEDTAKTEEKPAENSKTEDAEDEL